MIEVADGSTEEWFLEPEDVGLERTELDRIAGGSPDENAAIVRAVLAGDDGPAREVVVLNAGAAIVAAGAADDLAGGIERARRSIDDGEASSVLARLVELTQRLA